MTVWPEAKQIIKPCEVCGEMMEVPKTRKMCTKCRRKREDENKRQRRELLKRS